MAEPVEYESHGPVVTLWLNRPEVKNAYDLALLEALDVGLERAEQVLPAKAEAYRAMADAARAYDGSEPVREGALLGRR